MTYFRTFIAFETDTEDLVLISKNDEELSGPEGIRTPDLRHVRATQFCTQI